MRALKYTLILIFPGFLVAGLLMGGPWAWAVPLAAFGLIPLMELLFAPDPSNADAVELEIRKADRIYDYMLYLVVPVQYALLFFFLYSITHNSYAGWEMAGLIFGMGILCGAMGINVAHELGHRSTRHEQWMAKALLMTSLYMHFFIEHNRGHHRNVSTPVDPSSARRNESVYAFWVRSVSMAWLSAWRLEAERLHRAGKPVFSWQNEMLRFQVIQLVFMALIFFLFGLPGLLAFIAAAVIGFLMLETVNYIEHYGLSRSETAPGKYERVMPQHSWNSDHIIGRLVLFELSRHSDHHFKASKKYQTLEHHEHSPQMPTGYPGMMVLSLFPPLWFGVMNRRLVGSR